MTTKDQERAALAKIRKIVEGLGENSYIGTAFEGCFEIAEDNITNDFGCSMKQRAESAEREAAEQKKLVNKFAAEYKALSEKKREMSAEMNEMLNKIDYQKATIKAMEQEAKQEQERTDKAIAELSDKLLEEHNRAAELENEIIRLKARLFDLIDKQ